MALQDLIKKIIAESEKEAQKIIDAALKSVEDIKAEALVVRKTEEEALEVKAQNAVTAVDAKIMTMARRENKNALQVAKRTILDKSMTQLLAAVSDLSEAENKALFVSLIKRLDLSNLDDAKFEVSAKNESALKDALGKSTAKVVVNEEVTSGFMVHIGSAIIDSTLKNLVFAEYKSELEIYIANQLKLTS